MIRTKCHIEAGSENPVGTEVSHLMLVCSQRQKNKRRLAYLKANIWNANNNLFFKEKYPIQLGKCLRTFLDSSKKET